ncbi:MAG: ATP-binding protein [Synergistaceae bacterium]|nr:ATP-binding protein [Synergistaceae bacterium]
MKMLCVVLVAFGSVIMLYSIAKYYKSLVDLTRQTGSHSIFTEWIYAACLIMMIFFQIGYIITLMFYVASYSLSFQDLLIALIFFFGAIFVLAMTTMMQHTYDKADLMVRLEQQESKLEAIKAQHEKEKAEASTNAKSSFLAMMSHEIRTPINAVIGMAELALRDDISPDAQGHIITIKQAGKNLLAIINDILDFSKIETGKLEIIKAEYSFASLVNDVISIINMRVFESRLRFVVYIDNNIPGALFGDEVRIRQILINLLNNAVKYTEKGFVSLSVCGEIVNDNTVNLLIEVSDSGKGIREEHFEKLFEEFFQTDQEKSSVMEGTGLGLAITRNLVNVMGGEISVSSEIGKGSKFSIRLPQGFSKPDKLAYVENPHEKNVLIYDRRKIYCDYIVRAMDDLGVSYTIVSDIEEFYSKLVSNEFHFVFVANALFQSVKKIHSEIESKSKIVLVSEFGKTVTEQNVIALYTPIYSIPVANILNGVSNSFIIDMNNEYLLRFVAPDAKVLIVDDINTNLKVAEGLMMPYEMQIDMCKSGYEAIQAVESTYYDIVFMDHMMPELDGIKATSIIREKGNEYPYFKDLPIIALTANAISGMKEMFLKNGFNDFLAKPIDIEKLNTILETWIPKEKQTKKNVNVVKEFYDSETIKIEGVDVNKGIAAVGGKIKNYFNTLSVFHEDGTQKIKDIVICLEKEDLALYTTYVHALKSATANIGATTLSKVAENLEIAGKNGDMDFIETHGAQFLTNFEALLDNIKAVLSEESRKESGDFIDYGRLEAALSKLETALDVFDSVMIKQAVSELRELSQKVAPGVSGTVENILKNVLMGEYSGAIELIGLLRNESGQ